MRSNRKRHIVVVGVVALSLLGAGAAVAAINSGPSSLIRHAFHQGGMNHGGMAGGVVMDAAAEYIGVSETALMSERHDGKSLAQIAVEHGKTAAGLEQTLVAAFKANSNTAVAAGRITADQAATGARDLPVEGADDDRSHGHRADGRPRCRDGDGHGPRRRNGSRHGRRRALTRQAA